MENFQDTSHVEVGLSMTPHNLSADEIIDLEYRWMNLLRHTFPNFDANRFIEGISHRDNDVFKKSGILTASDVLYPRQHDALYRSYMNLLAVDNQVSTYRVRAISKLVEQKLKNGVAHNCAAAALSGLMTPGEVRFFMIREDARIDGDANIDSLIMPSMEPHNVREGVTFRVRTICAYIDDAMNELNEWFTLKLVVDDLAPLVKVFPHFDWKAILRPFFHSYSEGLEFVYDLARSLRYALFYLKRVVCNVNPSLDFLEKLSLYVYHGRLVLFQSFAVLAANGNGNGLETTLYGILKELQRMDRFKRPSLHVPYYPVQGLTFGRFAAANYNVLNTEHQTQGYVNTAKLYRKWRDKMNFDYHFEIHHDVDVESYLVSEFLLIGQNPLEKFQLSFE